MDKYEFIKAKLSLLPDMPPKESCKALYPGCALNVQWLQLRRRLIFCFYDTSHAGTLDFASLNQLLNDMDNPQKGQALAWWGLSKDLRHRLRRSERPEHAQSRSAAHPAHSASPAPTSHLSPHTSHVTPHTSHRSPLTSPPQVELAIALVNRLEPYVSGNADDIKAFSDNMEEQSKHLADAPFGEPMVRTK